MNNNISNKVSVSRVVLCVNVFILLALLVIGINLEEKSNWINLATYLFAVTTLWMLWLESRKFSFDDLPASVENSMESLSPVISGPCQQHSAALHLDSEQIRVFGSLEDGQRYGWNFYDEIGQLGSNALYLWAEFNGKKWKYDGLSGKPDAVVPDNTRVFGRIRYISEMY